ncbi:MAG: NADH-quinone oxidoreductase subunit, partial [Planctomycetota bacterium]
MTGETLRNLLMTAWLLPLVGFAVEIFGGYWGGRRTRAAAWLAVACIATGFLCSATALVTWGNASNWTVLSHADSHGHSDGHTDGHSGSHTKEHSAEPTQPADPAPAPAK